jgi:hypothetical protein
LIISQHRRIIYTRNSNTVSQLCTPVQQTVVKTFSSTTPECGGNNPGVMNCLGLLLRRQGNQMVLSRHSTQLLCG